MVKNIEALIFDLDGTLLDRTAMLEAFAREQYHEFHLDARDISVNDYISCVLKHDNNGYSQKTKLYNGVLKELKISGLNAQEIIDHYYDHFAYQTILFPRVHDILEILSKHYRLGLITNGSSLIQGRKIRHSGLSRHFQCMIISEKFGHKKPDPRIFQSCLKDLNTDAAKAVYVGDHPDKDIVAAQSLGMQTIWVKNNNYSSTPEANHSISDISQLKDLFL